MKKHQTTFHLTDRDREAIREIREYYGLTSDIDAVRIALRELQRHIQATPPQPQQGLASHPAP